MANTFTKIAAASVTGASQATLEFTTIPNTYTDLLLAISVRTNRDTYGDDLKLLVNASSSAVYTNIRLYGDGSTDNADGISNTAVPYIGAGTAATATANTFSNCEIYFSNYTSSNTKIAHSRSTNDNMSSSGSLFLGCWQWAPVTQAAISTITLYPYNGTLFLQYSEAILYGIKKD
jgi:hypothetical protein